MSDTHRSVPLAQLAALAVEHWRLSTALAGPAASAPTRHALRKIGDFLAGCEVEIRTFDNEPYDPGLAVQVVDRVESPSLPRGAAVVTETLSPMVLHRGQVLRSADVVITTGPR